MREAPLTKENATLVAESGARTGGHFRTAKLSNVLTKARHLVICEKCQANNRIMIGFEGRAIVDHFRPNVRITADGEVATLSDSEIPKIPDSKFTTAVRRLKKFFVAMLRPIPKIRKEQL